MTERPDPTREHLNFNRASDAVHDALAKLHDALARMHGVAASALTQRDELRAILGPLLESPLIGTNDTGYRCLFCDVGADMHGLVDHNDGCPILRRDALLGRS